MSDNESRALQREIARWQALALQMAKEDPEHNMKHYLVHEALSAPLTMGQALRVNLRLKRLRDQVRTMSALLVRCLDYNLMGDDDLIREIRAALAEEERWQNDRGDNSA